MNTRERAEEIIDNIESLRKFYIQIMLREDGEWAARKLLEALEVVEWMLGVAEYGEYTEIECLAQIERKARQFLEGSDSE